MALTLQLVDGPDLTIAIPTDKGKKRKTHLGFEGKAQDSEAVSLTLTSEIGCFCPSSGILVQS
ncbi:hypothetical protein G4B88_018412 [Cannabis sativa]|uniref:Uncharacterized protein n=1 Tax=Cannabis sativa TaxID=3483 RepID=A0A7J6DLB5_CANSA|nr:hypothetical protein G4B88_018412 [Cannabis sativa]